jgi:hypothetical protein
MDKKFILNFTLFAHVLRKQGESSALTLMESIVRIINYHSYFRDMDLM